MNPFDQFDAPQQKNPFDQFDASSIGIDFNRPIEQVRADIDRLPKEQRQAALDQWADAYVANERKGGGIGQKVGDLARNVARGVGIGSWLGEANAATASALQGVPYDEALAYQNALDRASENDSATIGTIPKAVPVIGGTEVKASGVAKAAGALASAPVTPMLQIARGATLPAQMANVGFTGGVYGALYGSGEGNTAEERLENARTGAKWGAGLGAASVPVARGVANSAGYMRERLAPRQGPLRDYRRASVNRVADAATQDDLAATYGRQAADLGPEGMLADMGPNLTADAALLSRQPGTRSQMSRALNPRHDAAAARITAETDRALGPAANIPESRALTEAHAKAAAAPYRQAFEASPVPYTNRLEGIVNRLSGSRAGNTILRHARDLADFDPTTGQRQFFAREGADGAWTIDRVPNAREWDYMKRALADVAYDKNQQGNMRRIYRHWEKTVRDAVDEALSPDAPNRSPWAQARQFERVSKQFNEGVEEGADAFKKGLTPDQMRASIYGTGTPPQGGMTPVKRQAYQVGAREHVRNIMGNAATRAGANPDTAARTQLGTQHAREKIEIIAGRRAADDLIRRLDAETTFANTRERAFGNSITQEMAERAKLYPGQVDRPTFGGTRPIWESIGALPNYAINRAANAAVGGAMDRARALNNADTARALTLQGAERDAFTAALIDYLNRRNLDPGVRAAIEAIVGQSINAARPGIVSEAID